MTHTLEDSRVAHILSLHLTRTRPMAVNWNSNSRISAIPHSKFATPESFPDGVGQVSQAARDPGWSIPTGRRVATSPAPRLLFMPWRAPAALLAYLGLTVLLFAQAWAHPFTSSIGYRGDAEDFMWFLSWPGFALTHGLNPVFTTYLDYPAGVNLMANTTLPLVGTVLSPIAAIFGPVFTYNTVETLALTLSGWCAYLLIRRHVTSHLAAALGGLLYGFSPLMLGQSLGHPHVSAAFLPPLIFIALEEAVIRQRRRPVPIGILLGALGAAQALIGEDVLAMTAIVGLLAIGLLAGLHPGQVRVRRDHAFRVFGVAALTFILLAGPAVAFQFLGPQATHDRAHGPNFWVSDLLGFVVPTKLQWLTLPPLLALRDRLTGTLIESSNYLGIPLIAVLGFISWRLWSNALVRLVALLGVLAAMLSLGVTIHAAGRLTLVPVAVLALGFPVFRRVLPGRLLLYEFLIAWIAMAQLPPLTNMLPVRLMLFVFLMAGVLLAVFVDHLVRAQTLRSRVLAGFVAVLALAPLFPRLPYPATPVEVPPFFAHSAIPDGSVAVIFPFVDPTHTAAVLWQAESGMRFKMPEGYAFVPPGQGNVEPPPSATGFAGLAIAGGADPAGFPVSLEEQVQRELNAWHVRTVIVGPMANQGRMVAFITGVLGREPVYTGGVYAWEGLDLTR